MDKLGKIICTICAREGSKGVKGKNIKVLNGKPLINHTINQAVNSGLFDYIVVSSDSDTILDIANRSNPNLLVKRPNELASDHISKLPAIRHALNEAEKVSGHKFSTIVDLDPTSPLRLISDLEKSLEQFKQSDSLNLITGCTSRRSPYFNLVEKDKNGNINLSKKLSEPIYRRQDSPKCFDMNASIYIWSRNTLFDHDTVFTDKTELYEMPESRSIDIDNQLDFLIVEHILKNGLNESEIS